MCVFVFATMETLLPGGMETSGGRVYRQNLLTSRYIRIFFLLLNDINIFSGGGRIWVCANQPTAHNREARRGVVFGFGC